MHRPKPLLVQSVALALLQHDAIKARSHLWLEYEVSHPSLGVGNAEHSGKLASGLSHSGRRSGLRPYCAQLVDKIAEFPGEMALPASGSSSRDLQGDREEPLVVPRGVAPDECL